jgi:hypothetical protein
MIDKRDLAICTTCGQEYVNVYQPGGSMEGMEGPEGKKFEFRDITECVECFEEFVRFELIRLEKEKK